MPLPLAIPLAVAGVNLIGGGIKSYQARKALKNLQNEPLAEYSLTPEMKSSYERAQSMANRGFTGEETAAFKSNLAQRGNQAFRRSVDQAGGSLAGAINAGINYGNIGALNQFAGQDANLKRQNIRYADQLAGQVQNIQNMNTQLAAQRRQQLEQSYGGALAQGLSQIGSAPGQFAALYTAGQGYGTPNLNMSTKQYGSINPYVGQVDIGEMERYSNVG